MQHVITSSGSRKVSILVLQMNLSCRTSYLHLINSHKLYANSVLFFPVVVSFIMALLILRRPFTLISRIVEGIQTESLALWYCNSYDKAVLILRRMFRFFSSL